MDRQASEEVQFHGRYRRGNKNPSIRLRLRRRFPAEDRLLLRPLAPPFSIRHP
ncbi:unnamed protein product [Linum tenue]|uniref:Uncharacterized protein n=1 Tax=Linum tenue TaxID=586396 RepID=A0AAV0RQH3_9ROSI|nr:unnamed protein product [Linum tenue]